MLSCLSVLCLGGSAFAQAPSLSLASGSAVRGGSIPLNLSLTAGTSAPAALQWMLSYPANDITSLSISAGTALTSAGKTLSCSPGAGSITCVASAANPNTISSGVVAVVTATIASGTSDGSDSILISNILGVTPNATAESVTGTGGLITLLNPPPVITSAANGTGTVGSAFSYQITATNSPASFGASGLPAGLSINTSTGLISGAPTAAGTSSVTLSATNSGGTGTSTLTVTIAPAAPVITSATTAAGTVGAAFAYQITANNSPTSYAATGLPAGLSINTSTGLISGAPTAAGTSSVALSATNSGGTGQSTLTLTIALSSPLLQMHLDQTEVSGVTNGSVVTPSIAPAGFTGAVVANGTGSVNFTPAETGNGVYFVNCCVNSNNAYYQFTGSTIGNIFNTSQGSITFYLKSRYSFEQRTANASSPRYAFDVRDGNGNHLFGFLTQVSGGYLYFNYIIAGTGQYTWLQQGTEDSTFGNGVILQVQMTWGAGVTNLYLNGALVKSAPYSVPATNWSASSVFDVGAYEYQTFGGFDGLDDVIDEFTVLPTSGQ